MKTERRMSQRRGKNKVPEVGLSLFCSKNKRKTSVANWGAWGGFKPLEGCRYLCGKTVKKQRIKGPCVCTNCPLPVQKGQKWQHCQSTSSFFSCKGQEPKSNQIKSRIKRGRTYWLVCLKDSGVFPVLALFVVRLSEWQKCGLHP